MKIKKINNKYQVRKMIKGKSYYLYFDNYPTKRDITNALIEKAKTTQDTIQDIKDLNYCIQEYIKNRTDTLSPSTIRGYQYTLRTIPQEILQQPIEKIDTNTLQKYINQLSGKKKTKTIKNHIGLILSVLNYNNIEKRYNLKYPQKIKTPPYIPSDEDIKKIDTKLLHTQYYIFFRLCLYGLRVSEIMALTINDIKSDGTLTINKAKVKDIKNIWHIKTTKTIKSNRVIKIDPKLAQKIINQGYVINTPYKSFYLHLTKILNQLNIKHFSPHKFRHYMASKMHSMNIPTKYIQEYGGWANDTILNNIYTHTIDTEKEKYYTMLNTELENIIK